MTPPSRTLALLALAAASASPLQPSAAAQERRELASAAYLLQIGDTIDVKYRATPEYDQSLVILPDGDVSLTLLGEVHIAGLSVDQARSLIMAAAARRLRDPEISLSVKEGDRDRFSVLGEVTTPGRFELHGSTTAVEALALAGGFKTTSSQSNVYLIHRLSSGSDYGEATLIDFRKLRRIGATTEMPLMQPGDVLFVTTNRFSKLERIVHLSGIGLYYPLP